MSTSTAIAIPAIRWTSGQLRLPSLGISASENFETRIWAAIATPRSTASIDQRALGSPHAFAVNDLETPKRLTFTLYHGRKEAMRRRAPAAAMIFSLVLSLSTVLPPGEPRESANAWGS